MKNTNSTLMADISVLLTNDQTATLDEFALAVRRKTGQAISRSAIIRATLTAILPYLPDMQWCASEKELSYAVSTQLTRGEK